MFKLKNEELKRRETCSSRGFCIITHTKHNYVKLKSEEFLNKIKNFNEDFEKFLIAIGITEILTQTVVSFGYLISCIASSVQMALAFGPTLLIPLMLFGGLFLNNGTIPVRFINE